MKTVRTELFILTVLAALEWLDVIHYVLALIISILILCVIVITCIIYLAKRKYKLFAHLTALTIIILSISYLIGIDIPPYFRKDLWKDSITMQESIKDKAFICQYKILGKESYNKYGLVAKEIFAEKDHRYRSDFSHFFHYSDTLSILHLIIENEEEIRERGYGHVWRFEKSSCGTRCQDNICQFELLMSYNLNDLKDTLLVKIVDYQTEAYLDTISLIKVKTNDK